MAKRYDKIIIGAGLYGLYSALFSAKRGDSVLVLEKDAGAFRRATTVNQARVHLGYHYPRSYSTAVKSKKYFERFSADYSFCINSDFTQIYATSGHFSWTDRKRFVKFCADADIPCTEMSPDNYFNPGSCDGAYITREYTYDAALLRDYFLDELKGRGNAEIRFCAGVTAIDRGDGYFSVKAGEERFETPFLLNTSYAACNEINQMAGFAPFGIKYELCEIILCTVDAPLADIGFTVMDGPFFSIMPFGKTGLHSLTSVTFTPHQTSYESLPSFACQRNSGGRCAPGGLHNCDECPAKPETAYPFMSTLARKYLKPEYGFRYRASRFSMKPILTTSEIDDSRPTLVRKLSEDPVFVSVLSGKINTVYDLDEVLSDG